MNYRTDILRRTRTPTGQCVEVGDVHHSGESTSDGGESLPSQLLGRRMTLREVIGRINAIIAPLFTQLEMLSQSMRELSERSSTRSIEENVASERSRSSLQRSDKYQNYKSEKFSDL